jgi:hypothetical protein
MPTHRAPSSADPSDSPQLERRAAHRLAERHLVELENLLIAPAPVYAHGVVMAAKIVGDGTGPLYAPSRRGELRDRVTKVLAALRGAF